jgi:hypothetical protein
MDRRFILHCFRWLSYKFFFAYLNSYQIFSL